MEACEGLWSTTRRPISSEKASLNELNPNNVMYLRICSSSWSFLPQAAQSVPFSARCSSKLTRHNQVLKRSCRVSGIATKIHTQALPYILLCAVDVSGRSTMVFPDFDESRTHDASAIAFSPDGSILYIAANFRLYSANSNALSIPDWSTSASDDNLCDMSVSPDGLSVRPMGG